MKLQSSNNIEKTNYIINVLLNEHKPAQSHLFPASLPLDFEHQNTLNIKSAFQFEEYEILLL